MKFPPISLTKVLQVIKIARTAKQTVSTIQRRRQTNKAIAAPTLARISEDLHKYISNQVNELHLASKDGTEAEMQMLRKRLNKLKTTAEKIKEVLLEDHSVSRRAR